MHLLLFIKMDLFSPAHSIILDMSDSIWRKAFTSDELEEIKSSLRMKDVREEWPPAMKEMLMQLDRKVTFGSRIIFLFLNIFKTENVSRDVRRD
jgi:hypothetical protein